MLLGITADTHDHVDNVRRLVDRFNEAGCDLVVHVGDFVSPIVLPPLRRLEAKLVGVWGDNDANRRAIEGGLRTVGRVYEPPYEMDLDNGWRLLLSHQPLPKPLLEARQQADSSEHTLAVQGHTHHAGVRRYPGVLLLNPGEACGWVTGRATAALFDTRDGCAEVFDLVDGETIQTIRLN